MRGESQRFFEIFQANVYFIYEKPLTKCVNLVSGYVGWRTCLLLPGTYPLAGAGGLVALEDIAGVDLGLYIIQCLVVAISDDSITLLLKLIQVIHNL